MQGLCLAETTKKRSSYLPTLDGWRAVAILAVLGSHDAVHTLGPLNTRYLNDIGGNGVGVFFAISGFLICSRLLDEETLRGRISLKGFYERRAFRILPAAMLFLAVISILGALALIPLNWREVLASLFFFRNYPRLFGFNAGPLTWYTAHFWSLAVEEQFYFFLPVLLVFTPKRWRAWTLLGLSLLIAANRFVQSQHRPFNLMQFHSEVRIDCLLVPALFAVVAYAPAARARVARWLRPWPLYFALVLCFLPFGDETWWHTTITTWAFPVVVVGAVLNPDNVFGRVLEWAPLRFVGRISYSLYLWQQLFFITHFGPATSEIHIVQTWPLRLVLTFSCALLSYYLLERPLVKLGHRLSPPATPPR